MVEDKDGKINKGPACDNCRIKKIKCDHGQPCGRCLKAQERTIKKNRVCKIQLPLLKCTYEYKINTVKRDVQHSEKRVSERQINSLLNDKINDLDQIILKDETILNKMDMLKNLSLGEIEKKLTSKDENNQMVQMLNGIATNLNFLMKKDLKSEKQIFENSIADIYSKVIEYDIQTNSILKSLKNESAFNFEFQSSDKKIIKKSQNSKLGKKLGIKISKNDHKEDEFPKASTYNQVKPENKGLHNSFQEQEKNLLHNAYQEQEKEGFDSAFINHSKVHGKASLKSKISEITNPEILSNLLKSTKAYSNVAYYLSRIKHLSDLLKSDSELYLKKLLQNINQPVYLDVPYELFDLLVKTYDEDLQYCNFYITKSLLKKLAFHFKHDQKRMNETDVFLMNVILLMSCQALKFTVNPRSNDSKQYDKESIQEWETIFLLNCLAFYQKLLTFPKPVINPSLDFAMLFEKTLRKLQAFFLLGHYFNTSPCPRLSVHLFSIVTTIGQDFNYDNLGTYGSSLNMELKIQARNLWICSFITEKHISVTFGNPEFILGFDYKVMIDEIFKHSLKCYDIKFDFNEDDIPVDYSNANTPWIQFLKKQKSGLLVIGFFLRLQLLQIETVYYKTIVASKNENENPMITLKKAETLLKAYEDFEIIARNYLDIDCDTSVDDWIKNLFKRFKENKLSHKDKLNVDLSTYLFLTLYTLKLSCTIIVADIRCNLKYNDTCDENKCDLVYSFTVILSTQLSILEYLLETGWSYCASSEIALCYVSCLACLFYNSVLDKDYFKVHIKRMMSIIKKFSTISAEQYFFDPVKWNTAAAHSIFFMRILAACHPDIFEEVLQIDPKTVFYEEYEQAYESIKNFKTTSFKNIKKGKNFIKDLKDSEKVFFTDSSIYNPNVVTQSPLQDINNYTTNDKQNPFVEKKEKVYMSPFMVNTNSFPFSPSVISLNNNSDNDDSNHTLNRWLFKQSLDSESSNDDTESDKRLWNLLDPKCVFNVNEEEKLFTRRNSYENKNMFDNELKYPNEQQMFAVSNDLDSLMKYNFYTSSVFNVDDFLKDDMLFDQVDKEGI